MYFFLNIKYFNFKFAHTNFRLQMLTVCVCVCRKLGVHKSGLMLGKGRQHGDDNKTDCFRIIVLIYNLTCTKLCGEMQSKVMRRKAETPRGKCSKLEREREKCYHHGR